MTYPKIPSVWRRESERPHRVLVGEWSTPELEMLADIEWSFTEKVDGTNIRIIWDGHRVTFGGRTDNAQLPAKLIPVLDDLFKGEVNEQVFEQTWGDSPAVLYGEGFGPSIQSGGKYTTEPAFVLFDVTVAEWWLRRPDVEDVASRFGVPVVPVVLAGSLADAIDLVKRGLTSDWGDFEAEGVVGKPVIDLFDRKGERIAVKIKARDLR